MSHVTADLPMKDYVADEVGAPTATLNSGTAVRLLERSPLHAWMAHPKLNDKWEQRHAEMFDIGTAAHALLLENKPETLAIWPGDDWRKGEAKEFRDAARAEGKTPVLAAQARAAADMAEQAALAVERCDDLRGIWDGGHVEETHVWQYDEHGVWLRCRPDITPADRRVIMSYKTTGQSAEPDSYVRTLTNLSYEVQAAFELAAVEAETGTRSKYIWLVGEVEPPYACSILGLSTEMEDYGVSRMNAAVTRWRDCLTRNRWPGYSSRVAWLETPSYLRMQWAEREGLFRPWREQPAFFPQDESAEVPA